MGGRPFLGIAVAALALASASCGSPSRQGTSSVTTTPRSSTTSPPGGAASTKHSETLTATATVSPDQGLAETTFNFSVVIRGSGTLDSESVQFGDGDTSGANAGTITCGQTVLADHTSTYSHAYTEPGTYRFNDDVDVLGPPSSCRHMRTSATIDVVVAASLSQATGNGAFLSPSKNIACVINALEGQDRVRCASFSPPLLATMDRQGAVHTCTGTQCQLGNPAIDTPVLPYGSATGDDTFQCLSTKAGMTCTVEGHVGFKISRTGVERIP